MASNQRITVNDFSQAVLFKTIDCIIAKVQAVMITRFMFTI